MKCNMMSWIKSHFYREEMFPSNDMPQTDSSFTFVVSVIKDFSD